MSSKDMKESTISGTGLRLLPKSFSPSVNEVIIGRGRKVVNHIGNQRFQDLIHSHLNEYSKSKSKASKSVIIRRVLMIVKEGSPVGGFVKQDASTKRWYAMEEASARISTAQAFRDALSGSYRSSRQYKQQRRWNMRSPGDNGDVEETTELTESTPVPPVLPSKNITVEPTTPCRVLEQPASAGQGIAGLRGILSSALDLMDDDMFDDDFDSAATILPDLTESFATATPTVTTVEAPHGDALGSLLERYEVEITEDPFEPTPLKLNNYNINNKAMPSLLHHMPVKSFSLFQKTFPSSPSEFASIVQKAAPVTTTNTGGSMSLRNVMAL